MMQKVNQLEALKQDKTKIAFVGVCSSCDSQLVKSAKKYSTLVYDEDLGDHQQHQFLIELIKKSKGFAPNFRLEAVNETAQLSGTGVFVISNSGAASVDWMALKRSAKLIGQNLSKGDWVIFNQGVEPDMAEIVLLSIIEKESGLSLAKDFEAAFHPSTVKKDSMVDASNLLKISHNLIIEAVCEIFDLKSYLNEKAPRIDYVNESFQAERIKERIKQKWVPTMNKMDEDQFAKFTRLSAFHGFLDSFEDLRFISEWRTDFRRFFRYASQLGLRHDPWQHLDAEALKGVRRAIAL
jgi:hydrogenase maturation factor